MQFYLITNIQGTSHIDVGSMDQLSERLRGELSVPFMCWWRDDINRRLDNAWAVKWVYPELMTGPDFLRAVIESGLSEHRERREGAIRAFLTQQYSTDEQVRFKQVELQNHLIDLFVDVPVAFRELGSDIGRPAYSRESLVVFSTARSILMTLRQPCISLTTDTTARRQSDQQHCCWTRSSG